MSRAKLEETSLIIHGHFYQPPRENPWTGEIPTQAGAAPYHDWNERINEECYAPNAFSRILDRSEQITTLANNYASISFNIGPTLFEWIEHHAPEVYEKILEADKMSRETCSGHGNAIAQVYNHMIMPLANMRDKMTQVRWGIRDFEKRFGRSPEAIWLPETAVDMKTLEVLIDHKITYTILSPYQAARIREIGQKEWMDVSGGAIPTMPYRCFLKDSLGRTLPDRFIDLFFYDGPISREISFEHLLSHASLCADRLERAFKKQGGGLISVCTDGETYGHHHRFGDMCLSYLLNVEAPSRRFQITNFGEFLEKRPPTFEVELVSGSAGQGTSWSCPHGVARWNDDCGCSAGGKPGWHQKWRRPLRDALDWLREELISLFEKVGSRYLRNVWEARDHYIDVILDQSHEEMQEFLARHQKRLLTPDEAVVVFKLMEMQKYAMLMYTSCGWFFAELSGIETVQDLLYAARAIELAREAGESDLEGEFVERLASAKSNIKVYEDGKGVYRQLVKPAIVSKEMVVSYFAVKSLFEPREHLSFIDGYEIECHEYHRKSLEENTLIAGLVTLYSQRTWEKEEFAFILHDINGSDFHACVRSGGADEQYFSIRDLLLEELDHYQAHEIPEQIHQRFQGDCFTLNDLTADKGAEIFPYLIREQLKKLGETYFQLYEQNRTLIQNARRGYLPLPEELIIATEYTLHHLFSRQIEKFKETGNLSYLDQAEEIVSESEQFQVRLKRTAAEESYSEIVLKEIEKLEEDLTLEQCEKVILLLDWADRLELKINVIKPQNIIFEILTREIPSLLKQEDVPLVSSFLSIAARLNFNVDMISSPLAGSQG
ncbi:MAG: DUF3536 domain-containing protein [Candidatus Tectomicrobia bacterium]|nr:DUF3536 domain-containing protein [Candidatus Tectomicrobia bacterium]